MSSVAAFLAVGIRFATTINLAALGGTFTQKAGDWNIALEGMMLSSAFAAVWMSYQTGSPWLGLLFAMVIGLLVGLLLAFVVVTLGADVIIAGLAINLLASGGTKYMLPIAFGKSHSGAIVSDRIVGLPDLHIPLLSKVPVLGPALNDQSPLVYVGFLLVPAVAFVLYRTGFGLRLRAVGESPESALAAGISQAKMRYAAFVLSGVFCGMAGTQLSLGSVALFSEDMTSGVGYIAFAAVVFGNAFPPVVFLGALVFGVAQAASLRVGETFPIPSEFISALPYVVAVIALVIISQRRRTATLDPASA